MAYIGELCDEVTESLTLAEDEPGEGYEECVIHHTTLLNTNDVIHAKYRSPKTLPKEVLAESNSSFYDNVLEGDVNLYETTLPTATSSSVFYQDTLLLTDSTHVSHRPHKRLSIPTVAYEDTVIKLPQPAQHNYEDMLLLPRIEYLNLAQYSGETSDSEEELVELPRFRPRASANNKPALMAAAACARVTSSVFKQREMNELEYDDSDLTIYDHYDDSDLPFEYRRSLHEDEYGIPMLNELREVVPLIAPSIIPATQLGCSHCDSDIPCDLEGLYAQVNKADKKERQSVEELYSTAKTPIEAVEGFYSTAKTCISGSDGVYSTAKTPRLAQEQYSDEDVDDSLYQSTAGTIRIKSTAKGSQLYSIPALVPSSTIIEPPYNCTETLSTTLLPTTHPTLSTIIEPSSALLGPPYPCTLEPPNQQLPALAPKPGKPLQRQKSRKVSREDSSMFLAGANVGDYMLRRNKENTILSVKVYEKIKHFKVDETNGLVKVGKESFSSLEEMILFYKSTSPVSQHIAPVYLKEEVKVN